MNRKYLFFIVLWPLVLLPKSLQLLLLLAIGMFLSVYKIKNTNKVFLLVCAYACIHLLSIIINALIGDYDISRIAAAVNTAVIWIPAAFLYEYYRTTKIDIKKLLRICFWTENIMLILVTVYWYMAYVKNMVSFTMPLIHKIFYGYDWPLFRFWGLLEYPTLVGGFTMLVAPFACLYVWMQTKKLLPVFIYYLYSFVPIYYAFSRNGYVLYIGLLVLCIFYIFVKRFKKEEAYTGLVIAAGAVLVSIPVLLVLFNSLLEELLTMRGGSNLVRGELYQASLQAFAKSPIWGVGIKTLNHLFLPLGSHCSYIGYLYKTGILGTICILCAFVLLVVYILKNKQGIYHRLISFFLFAMLAYCIFEDLDGANWLVCLFFAVAGVLQNKENCWKRGDLE